MTSQPNTPLGQVAKLTSPCNLKETNRKETQRENADRLEGDAEKGWFATMPDQLQRQGQRMQQSLTTMLHHSELRPNLTALLLLVLLVVLLSQRGRIQVLLNNQQTQIQSTEQIAPPWLIAAALIKVALYVAPASLALLLIGQFIGSDEATEHLQPQKVFTALAFALFAISFLRKNIAPRRCLPKPFSNGLRPLASCLSVTLNYSQSPYYR